MCDEKVCSDLRAADALKAKQKSTGPSSNLCAIVTQFGPKLMDISSKPTGTKPKSLTKDGAKKIILTLPQKGPGMSKLDVG